MEPGWETERGRGGWGGRVTRLDVAPQVLSNFACGQQCRLMLPYLSIFFKRRARKPDFCVVLVGSSIQFLRKLCGPNSTCIQSRCGPWAATLHSLEESFGILQF